MAFIISLTTRLKSTNTALFPLLLRQILHSPLPPPSPTLPICYSSATRKTHFPKGPFFSFDSSPDHFFYQTRDFEADETEPCSDSFYSSATTKTHLSIDAFFPVEPSPNRYLHEKSDFEADGTEPFSDSSYSSPTPKTQLRKDPLSPLEPSPNHYFYESSDFEADEIEPCCDSELHGFLQILSQTKQFSSDEDALDFLRESGVRPSSSLLYSAMWELRKEWKLAFLAFRWGEKCNSSSLEAWNLMVWILGKQRRFDIAWRLVRDMHRSAMATRKALLIMIKR